MYSRGSCILNQLIDTRFVIYEKACVIRVSGLDVGSQVNLRI